MMLPPESVEAMKARRRVRILREASPGMIERHTIRTAIPMVAALFAGMLLATCARSPFRNWGHHLTRAAFVNVNVIRTGTNEVLPGRTVYIEDGIIRRVGPAHDIKIPADTYIIDASGKYLLPGLADMHIHHRGDFGFTNSEEDLVLYLVNGVTTVRNMSGSAWDLKVRQKIRSRQIPGPHYYTCGPTIGGATATPEATERIVLEQKRAGYDCVKLYSGIPQAAFSKAIRTAEAAGIPAVGHAQPRLPFEYTLQLRSIEHLEEILGFFSYSPPNATSQSVVEQIAARNVFLTPTLVVPEGYKYFFSEEERNRLMSRSQTAYVMPTPLAAFLSPESSAWKSVHGFGHDRLERDRQLALQYVPFLHDHGVKLLLGTDGFAFAPGFSVHDELANLVAAGLKPHQALTTATVNPAEYLGKSRTAGSIDSGKVSDLVLLDENPLQDISSTRTVRGVMIGRLWIDKNDIEAALRKLKKK